MAHRRRTPTLRSPAPSALAWGVALALGACAGQAPGTRLGEPDAGFDPGSDGSLPPEIGQSVTGKTMDYFGGIGLPLTTLTTDGILPPVSAASDTAGLYQLTGVPTGSKLYVDAARTGYASTRNEPVAVAGAPVTQDLYAVATVDVRRQYATVGLPVAVGRAVAIVTLAGADGSPLEGLPPTAVTLVDDAGAAVPGVSGPFFFAATGDVAPTTGPGAVATSTMFGGRARAAFLAVPPGNFTVKIDAPAGPLSVSITAAADGVVLAKSGGKGGGSQPPPVANPTFVADVYPRLQRAVTGGLACANCHTAGGIAAVLPFDAPAQMTYEAMKAAPGVIDLANPAASLLLVKPLYEAPPAMQDHPNATFLTEDDPDYKLLLRWITQGAKP